MRVTVCQLHDEREAFERDWEGLVAHVRSEKSMGQADEAKRTDPRYSAV